MDTSENDPAAETVGSIDPVGSALQKVKGDATGRTPAGQQNHKA